MSTSPKSSFAPQSPGGTGGFAPQSPRAGGRPTMSNFGAFIPRPQPTTEGSSTGASVASGRGGAPRSPRLSFDGMRPAPGTGATSPRGSNSGGAGFDFFASAASFFAGTTSPRGEKPQPSTSLRKALAARGGVAGVKDGYEAFYGIENSNNGNRSPRQVNIESGNRSPRQKTRDGFDKFYGIQSRDKMCDEEVGDRQLGDKASGANAAPPLSRSHKEPVVPKGVPTFSLSGTQITSAPTNVETFSLCDPPDHPVQPQRESAVPTWAPPDV